MLLLWFLLGGTVELLNAALRARSVRGLGVASPVSGMAWVIGGLALRVAWTALMLMLAFRQSALYGVAALLGYWSSRWLAILWINRRYPV